MIGEGKMSCNRFIKMFGMVFDSGSVVSHAFLNSVAGFPYILYATYRTLNCIPNICGVTCNMMIDGVRFARDVTFE